MIKNDHMESREISKIEKLMPFWTLSTFVIFFVAILSVLFGIIVFVFASHETGFEAYAILYVSVLSSFFMSMSALYLRYKLKRNLLSSVVEVIWFGKDNTNAIVFAVKDTVTKLEMATAEIASFWFDKRRFDELTKQIGIAICDEQIKFSNSSVNAFSPYTIVYFCPSGTVKKTIIGRLKRRVSGLQISRSCFIDAGERIPTEKRLIVHEMLHVAMTGMGTSLSESQQHEVMIQHNLVNLLSR